MCPECDHRRLQPTVTTLSGATHGESFDLVSDALVCPGCGFKTISVEKMGEFGLRVADAYRIKHGLLTSTQIKDRRLDLGMNQQQFANYVGVGSSSVKRWELGSIQDVAMNDLILLKTDLQKASANLLEVQTRLGRIAPASFWSTPDNLVAGLANPGSGSEFAMAGTALNALWEPKDAPKQVYRSEPWRCQNIAPAVLERAAETEDGLVA